MKNYVVIGGSSGVGQALVQSLATEGNRVFATYNSTPAESNGNVTYFPFNVLTDELDLDQLPEEVHGLAYCPGSINLKPFHRFKDEDFVDDYRLQVVGAAAVLRQLLPRLKKSEHASVVFFSTIAVQHGFGFHAQVSASKGAIEGMTRALSAELAPAIRVNAVAPSLTDTPLAGRLLNTPEKKEAHAAKNPLKRVGEASDVAAAAHYLLSPKSSWITGQILPVDGGYSTIKQ